MIDCHVHLWDPADGHPWIRPDSPHFRRYSVEDLAGSGTFVEDLAVSGTSVEDLAVSGAGVEVAGSILVEAARGDTGETAALWEVAGRHPDLIAGYVANLHVHAEAGPAAFAALLDRYAPNGMRLGGPDWPRTPEAARALVPMLAERGVALELNLIQGALRTAAEVADRHPELTVIVDHLGNPGNLSAEDPATWRADVAYAARRPNVVIKISGLLTQQRGVRADRVAELGRHAVASFGPERCLVGSDWPICLTAGSRAKALELALLGLTGLTAAERERVLHGTAERVYRLHRVATEPDTRHDR